MKDWDLLWDSCLIALAGGYAVGPLVGGYIDAFVGWQFIFLAVIPFGLLSVVVYLLTAQKPEADNDFELINKREEYKKQNPDQSNVSLIARILDYKGAILQAASLIYTNLRVNIGTKIRISAYMTLYC